MKEYIAPDLEKIAMMPTEEIAYPSDYISEDTDDF